MQVILFLHIIGATIWTGGHIILATAYLPKALKSRDISDLQKFENGFEKIGIPALLLQVITGLWMSYQLVPNVGQWLDFSGSVNRIIATKLILLGITLALAVDARLRVIPKLNSENLNSLAWHIIPVTLISILFVYVGSSLRFGGI